MYCIYHSRDLDGWMSAAIVKKALEIDGSIEFIGWDYGQPIPELEPNRRVVMVDISFPMDTMYELAARSRDLLWIDHHISAIKDFHTWTGGLKGREFKSYLTKEGEKKAACELTWEYFYPTTPMPEVVRLLGAYDCFRHAGTDEEDDVFHFQYAARVMLGDLYKCYTALKNGVNTYEMIGAGIVILNYEKMNAIPIYANREEFTLPDVEAEYQGAVDQVASDKSPITYKVAAVNAHRFNPKTFDIDFHADGYDLFMSYHYNAKHGLFTVSIYSSTVDCSKIAKSFGGGGHAAAAGFEVKVGNHFLLHLISKKNI